MHFKKHLQVTLISLFLLPLIGFSQSANSSYKVQSNDWLSKIAENAYGNPHLYYRIIEGTNKKAAADNSFAKLGSPNDLKVGQKIWIPSLPSSQNLTDVPKTNCEIRLWYNYQIVAVGVINEKWIEDGVDLATRAQKAYEMRHEARVNARYMMQNKEEVSQLQARDMKKYGNPDGPTFDYLIKKNTDKGLSVEAAYQSIVDSSSRTDRNYNKDCQ